MQTIIILITNSIVKVALKGKIALKAATTITILFAITKEFTITNLFFRLTIILLELAIITSTINIVVLIKDLKINYLLITFNNFRVELSSRVIIKILTAVPY